VVVELSCADADLDFLKLVLDEEQRLGTSIPIDTLLVLSRLRE
jgi:ATP-dependent DNA helicase RecG